MPEARPAAPPPPDAVDPLSDPQNAERVEWAKAFAFHLGKAIKQIGMYRHNEAKFPEFLGKAHEEVRRYTEKHGPLSMKVEQQNLVLLGQNLFAEDTPLPYKFFRDGIRALIFRPGLTVQELVTFTLIALNETERTGEDVLNLLWKSGLEHVEYIVVEGFKMDESGSEEQTAVEVDKIVGYLYGRLKTSSDDFLRFARVSTEDLDAELSGVDQIRGAVVTGLTADDALKTRIQQEIQEEEQARLFPKLLAAVFQVIEGGTDDPALLEDVFLQLLDSMLLQEDFASINQIVLKLKVMEQKMGEDSKLAYLRRIFVQRMGEEQRLMRLADLLKTVRPKQPVDVQRFLGALEPESVPVLINVLEAVEIPENRALLYEVLSKAAAIRPEPFLNRLQSDRPQTVRDMVAILEKSGHPERMKFFANVMRHPNLAVRLEVLQIIGRGRSADARKVVFDALSDPAQQIRLLAARLLPAYDPEKAFIDIQRLLKDPSFEKRAPDEKAALWAAWVSTDQPAAFSGIVSTLQQKPTLLTRKKVQDDKLMVVAALGMAPSIQGYKILQALVEDKSQGPDLLVAARKAMYATKRALFGDAAGEPPPGGEA